MILRKAEREIESLENEDKYRCFFEDPEELPVMPKMGKFASAEKEEISGGLEELYGIWESFLRRKLNDFKVRHRLCKRRNRRSLRKLTSKKQQD